MRVMVRVVKMKRRVPSACLVKLNCARQERRSRVNRARVAMEESVIRFQCASHRVRSKASPREEPRAAMIAPGVRHLEVLTAVLAEAALGIRLV